MMNARQLITHCRDKDIHFEVIGLDELECTYPRGALENGLQEQLRENKAQIIQLLSPPLSKRFVYRVEIDEKKCTVISSQCLEQLTGTVCRKFGAERIGSVQQTWVQVVK